MRRAYNSSTWRDDSNNVIALNLGSDYCAEHEWGIKPLQDRLGIRRFPEIETYSRVITDKDRVASFEPYLSGKERKNLGLPMRTVNMVEGEKQTYYGKYELANNLDTKGVKLTNQEYDRETGYTAKTQHTMWGVHFRHVSPYQHPYDWKQVCGVWYNKGKEEAVCYWSDSEFAFFSEDKQMVKDFVDAFSRNDVAVWVGASGPFKNGGLVIAIASRIPQSFKDEMEQDDLDYVKLQIEAAKTNVRDALKEAKKEYFALSPRWKDDSKKQVIFWLNPKDQKNCNYGLYTAKELRQWAKGEGPVVEKKK